MPNSWFVAFLKRVEEKGISRWERAWHQVRIYPPLKAWVEKWKAAPLRAGGIFLLSAVAANALISWLFQKEAGFLSKFLWIACLCVGLGCLACPGNLEAIRERSLFLRLLFPRRISKSEPR